jgi:ATP-binding cassette subfamily B protein
MRGCSAKFCDALVEAPAAGHQAPGRARIDLTQGPLLGLAIALCGLALVTAVVPYARRYIESEMRRRLGLLLQDNVYRAINSFPGIERFESPRFADKLQLVQQVATGTGNSFAGSVLGLGQALISMVTLGLTPYVVSPAMAAAW